MGVWLPIKPRQLALLSARRSNPPTRQGFSVGSLPFWVGIRCRFVAVHLQIEMLHDCASADSWIPIIVGSLESSKSSFLRWPWGRSDKCAYKKG